MPRALWLLFRLRFIGWFRRIGRTFRTTKGALLTIISLLVMLACLLNMCVGMAFSSQGVVEPQTLQKIDQYAPFALLAYCILVIATSGGTSPFAFTPAEIQFLF